LLNRWILQISTKKKNERQADPTRWWTTEKPRKQKTPLNAIGFSEAQFY
jgi:hypothetical protein